MTVQMLSTPSGEKLVVVPLEEYEELVDARQHDAAMRAVAAGARETFSSDEAARHLAAPTPLAFWRVHRGFSLPALAERSGIGEVELRALEAGETTTDIRGYGRLARCLRVAIEDLAEGI